VLVTYYQIVMLQKIGIDLLSFVHVFGAYIVSAVADSMFLGS